MTDDAKKTELPMEKPVQCHRTGREFDLAEHQKCPYCYGQREDIASGDHEKFCDYKPGVDPVSFGFPGDSSRNQRG
jgi:hypothetical protein